MNSHSRFTIIAAALFIAFAAMTAHSQTTTSVTVTVDEKGSAVPGAKVTVKNQTTNQSFQKMTDENGSVVIDRLPPGNYSVGVAVTGIALTGKKDVQVEMNVVNLIPVVKAEATNQTTQQSFQGTLRSNGTVLMSGLPPGQYSIAVEATDISITENKNIQLSINELTGVSLAMVGPETTAALSTGPAPLGGSATEVQEARQELSSIPNQNNDLTTLLQIVPGAVATGPSSLGKVIVDGKGIDQQTVRLDGVDFTSLVDFPSADSAINPISSFQKPEVAGDLENPRVRSGAFGYEPRYGPGTGLVSEISTYKGSKSGWQFQVYGDLRNDAFNARNFFDYDGENGLRRTRFGGKFARSLDKSDRAFAFFAYDGGRGRSERNIYEAIPVDATTDNISGPLASSMRSFLPAGTQLVPNASLNSDFVIATRRGRTTAESNAWDARFDYLPFRTKGRTCPFLEGPRECNALVVRLTHQRAETDVPDGVTGRNQRQRFVFTNAVASWKSNKDAKPIRNELDRKRGTKEFGHQFKFGFNQTRVQMDVERPLSSDNLERSLITTGGTVNTQGLPLTPVLEGQSSSVPIASLGGLIPGVGRGLYLKPRSYSAIYDYSRVATSNRMHELYAGVEARFIRLDVDRLSGLTYNFPNVAALRTGIPSNVTFVSDLSSSSPFSQGSGPRHAQQEFYMGYFQRVSQFLRSIDENLEPAITLFYGVRYDHFGGVRERDNRMAAVDPHTGAVLPPGSSFYRVDHANIQPRAGISYRFADTGPGRYTVLRAGVGLYSGVPRIADLTLPIDSDRFSTGIDGGTFPMLPAQVMRGFIENPLTRQFQPLAFEKDFSPLERSLKWDVKLSHSHNGYDFSAYYIGNIGRNLALANFTNRIVSVTTNPDPAQPAIVTREFDVVNGNLVSKPFGEFFYRRGGGRSSFNALSLQLARDTDDQRNTPKRWLKIPVANFNAKYTLSRSVGNVSGTIMSNPLDPNADFGNNAGVPTHGFSLTTAYNLWQVAENRDPDNLLLGWKLLSNLKVTSGLPIAIRVQRPDVVYLDATGNVFSSPAAGRTARLNTPGGGSSAGAFIPNLVANVNPYNGGFADRAFLNPAAFSIPAPGELGNIRRGRLRGPMFVQLDLGLRRNLFFINKEKMFGEFQIDIFNVFNHANFSNPATTLPSSLGIAQNQLQPGVPFARATAGSFGVLTAAEPGRIIQFSLTLKFNEGFTK